jgi:hypothetical protein
MLPKSEWVNRLTEKGIDYLARYGYLPGGFAEQNIEPALELFREFLLPPKERAIGLESEEFRDIFLRTIGRGRCGFQDFDNGRVIVAEPLDVLRAREAQLLRYKIDGSHLPDGLDLTSVREAIGSAFSEGWGSIKIQGSPVFTFREVFTGDAHIKFSWVAMDGPGGQIGRGNRAGTGSGEGLVQFDIDDQWDVAGGLQDFDVETVSMHEIGHALGLGHLNIPAGERTPVMYPIFLTADGSRGLGPSDREAFLDIYGHRQVGDPLGSR